jgi:ferredoxin
MNAVTIHFPETDYPSVTVPKGSHLSEVFTVLNSPLLFGCRTGVCGTCLVQVKEGYEALEMPSAEEQEVLAIYSPDNPKARLACQLNIYQDVALQKIQGV